MERKDTEIPEDVFRKDFGGRAFEDERAHRMQGRQRRLVLGGLLALLTGPAVVAAVGAGIAMFYFCRTGAGCM